MNMSCMEAEREKEIIEFFKQKEFVFLFFADETIIELAMERFGISKTAAKRYIREYVVPLRKHLNSYIYEQMEAETPEEEIIKNCVEKYTYEKSDISDYMRRLKMYLSVNEMTQKLFEGVIFEIE